MFNDTLPLNPASGAQDVFSQRSALREWRRNNREAADAAGVPDSAGIGRLGAKELERLISEIGIDSPRVVNPSRAPSSADALADAIRAAMEAVAPAAAPMDEEAVRAIARDEAGKVAPRVLRVEIVKEGVTRTSKGQHWLFPLAAAVVGADVPLYLCGPAGGGKTTLAHAVADALGLPFSLNSFGPGMSEAKLTGYKDAVGAFHDTQLVRSYRDGGVWLADEIDRADGAILTTLNAPLANGAMSTPGGTLARHADFRVIAGANTAGTGASDLYTAAMELDASTLDRFFFLAMPYDERMEEVAALGSSSMPARECDLGAGGVVSPDKWLAGVRAARARCEALQMRHTVSPRASIYGAKLCRAGVGIDWLIPGLITRGLPAQEATALEAAFRGALK